MRYCFLGRWTCQLILENHPVVWRWLLKKIFVPDSRLLFKSVNHLRVTCHSFRFLKYFSRKDSKFWLQKIDFDRFWTDFFLYLLWFKTSYIPGLQATPQLYQIGSKTPEVENCPMAISKSSPYHSLGPSLFSSSVQEMIATHNYFYNCVIIL